MKTIRYIVSVVLLGAAASLNAQVLSNKTQWNSIVNVNLNSGESFSANISFVSDAGSFEMVQGEYITSFVLESVEGSWATTSEAGSLLLHVKDNGDTPGKVTLGRDENGLYIIVDMTQANPDGINRRFAIETFELK